MSNLDAFDALVSETISPILSTFGFIGIPAARSAIGPRYFKEFVRPGMSLTVNYEPHENHVEMRLRAPDRDDIGDSLGFLVISSGRPFAEYFPPKMNSFANWLDGYAALLVAEGTRFFGDKG